ncbi:MAG: septal ring lytic transglycosylase RlpA family protein [Gammaproteobacteria bacterium]
MLLIAGCTPGVYQSKPVDGPPAIVPAGLINLPDAIPRDEVPCGGCARPYVIDGVRYQPLASNLGYRERGHASWYGSAFHGNPTATGERYDMFAMTAAHKTLPLPSYARVRNLQNGRQVTVKVNDRGPFHAGRIIDLSYAAAVKLGIDQIGSAPVEVVALPLSAGAVSATNKPVSTVNGVYYQAGAFANPQNARALQVKLLAAGVEPVEIFAVEVNGRRLHRVRVGPVTEDIETLMIARLKDLGLYSPAKDTP